MLHFLFDSVIVQTEPPEFISSIIRLTIKVLHHTSPGGFAHSNSTNTRFSFH